jgi:hypothetical protein
MRVSRRVALNDVARAWGFVYSTGETSSVNVPIPSAPVQDHDAEPHEDNDCIARRL